MANTLKSTHIRLITTASILDRAIAELEKARTNACADNLAGTSYDLRAAIARVRDVQRSLGTVRLHARQKENTFSAGAAIERRGYPADAGNATVSRFVKVEA